MDFGLGISVLFCRRRVVYGLYLLKEFFSVLFILFAVLSLSSSVGVAYFNSLKLVLDRPHLVFEAVVLHLNLEHPNNIFDFGVILHCHVLRKWQIAHKLSLQFVHSFHVERHFQAVLAIGISKEL